MSDSVTPWPAARQAPLSMGILQARILEWVAMPSSRGIFPNPGIEPKSPALQVDSLPSELLGSYWREEPIPSPGDLSDPGIKPGF